MEFVENKRIDVIGKCLEDVISLEDNNPDTVVALFVINFNPPVYVCYNLLSLQTWFVKSGKTVLPDNRVQIQQGGFEVVNNWNLKAKLERIAPYGDVLQLHMDAGILTKESDFDTIHFIWNGPDDDFNENTAVALVKVNLEPPIFISYNVKSLQTWFRDYQSIALVNDHFSNAPLFKVLPVNRIKLSLSDFKRIRNYPKSTCIRKHGAGDGDASSL